VVVGGGVDGAAAAAAATATAAAAGLPSWITKSLGRWYGNAYLT